MTIDEYAEMVDSDGFQKRYELQRLNDLLMQAALLRGLDAKGDAELQIKISLMVKEIYQEIDDQLY